MCTIIHDFYPTDGSGNEISLEIQTGYGQSYTTSVTLNGTPKVVDPPADPIGNYVDDFTIVLDTNAALKDVLLEITAYATINMTPPNSSMLIILSGGIAIKQFAMDDLGTGKAPGDSIAYYASIALI